ncbi:hypothetical protein V8G54_014888 [Vigna mungo]|uniref:Uncharacterized protein n=1 Tax=Vigna mungo TaxID=3915 RepID=A0AAQ3NLF4_VIGMU
MIKLPIGVIKFDPCNMFLNSFMCHIILLLLFIASSWYLFFPLAFLSPTIMLMFACHGTITLQCQKFSTELSGQGFLSQLKRSTSMTPSLPRTHSISFILSNT